MNDSVGGGQQIKQKKKSGEKHKSLSAKPPKSDAGRAARVGWAPAQE